MLPTLSLQYCPPSMSRSPKWSLPIRFPNQKSEYISPCYVSVLVLSFYYSVGTVEKGHPVSHSRTSTFPLYVTVKMVPRNALQHSQRAVVFFCSVFNNPEYG
jgi:hypothetical protein